MSLTKSSVATLHARIAELEAERDRLKGQLCEWCAQGAPRDELVSDKHRIPSHSGHGWEYPACGLFRSPGARIAELEAERDRLQAKVAHLDKLAALYPISLGNACEERDKLKHSDRALRKENAALKAEKAECPWCSVGEKPVLSRWREVVVERDAPRKALEDAPHDVPQPTPQTLEQSSDHGCNSSVSLSEDKS